MSTQETKRKVGRPRKFKSVEDFDKAVDAFVAKREAVNMLFLLAYQGRGAGTDDRIAAKPEPTKPKLPGWERAS